MIPYRTFSIVLFLFAVVAGTGHILAEPATSPSTQAATEPADGSIVLKAEAARIHGFKLHLDPKTKNALVYWVDVNEYPEWPRAAKKGTYLVEVTYACPPKSGGEFAVTAAANRVSAKPDHTESWEVFTTKKMGKLTVLNDDTTIALRSLGSRSSRAFISVRSIKLTPTDADSTAPDKKGR